MMSRAILIVITLFVVFSCGKDEQNIPTDIDNLTSFPTKIGDEWTYSVYDSLSNSTVNIPVKITGTKTLHNGELVAIRISESGSFIDTTYIAVDNDTVKVYSPEYYNGTTYQAFEKWRFIFPLTSGSKWLINSLNDSAFVIGTEEEISVPAGTFQCHKVKIVQYGDERFGEQYLWLADSVGIVYEFEDSYGLAPWIGRIWQLNDYNVH